MKFGKYAIIDEVTHHFEKEPKWWWKVRPVTSGDELNMSKYLVHSRAETGADGVRREYPPTNLEITMREIALSFAGTNIPQGEKTVEDGGEPIIAKGADVETIESILKAMPTDLVMEIWNAVGEANPGWGPYRPKAKNSNKS